MSDEVPAPGELLRNLKELVELDRMFGLDSMPRIDGAASARGAASAAPAVVSGSPSPSPKPAAAPTPSADDSATTPAPALPSIETPAAANPQAGLEILAAQIADCRRCGLCEGRQQAVPGEGMAERPPVLFVGEGPGADEDRQGRPFVGAAGQLLDRMIVAMGLTREQVFIANIVKCRPPGNRTPEPEEVAACLGYLEAQVDLLKPAIICTLGNTPLRALGGDPRAGITRQRGRPFTWRGIPCIPTFHPSYLLRNDSAKKPCWEDLQAVLKAIGRTPPERRR